MAHPLANRKRDVPSPELTATALLWLMSLTGGPHAHSNSHADPHCACGAGRSRGHLR